MELESARVLVVDDELKIVDVVKSYLEKNGCAVSCAYSGEEALRQFERSRPSLVILDWMLPDRTGGDVCRALREKSNVPVILLTARVEEETVLQGFDCGADDYVTKPFSPRQLVARVQAVLRRAGGAPGQALSFEGGALTLDFAAHEVKKNGTAVSLTPNEFKILAALAGHPKKVFTRDELIDAISREEFDGFDRVIDTHVKNLRQKIEDDTKNPRYILTVHGVGYKFGGMQ